MQTPTEQFRAALTHLLKAVDGASQADLNRNGAVSVSEFIYLLSFLLLLLFYMIICLQSINTRVTIIYKQEGISPKKTKHGETKWK